MFKSIEAKFNAFVLTLGIVMGACVTQLALMEPSPVNEEPTVYGHRIDSNGQSQLVLNVK